MIDLDTIRASDTKSNIRYFVPTATPDIIPAPPSVYTVPTTEIIDA